MGSENGAIRVGRDDNAWEAVSIEDFLESIKHDRPRERRGSDVHTNGKDFDSEDANVRILRGDFFQKVDVGPEANLDKAELCLTECGLQ